jgi:hypothetical protein
LRKTLESQTGQRAGDLAIHRHKEMMARFISNQDNIERNNHGTTTAPQIAKIKNNEYI